MQKLKIFFHNNLSWLYTLQYIFFSIILLTGVALIDLRILPVLDYLPKMIQLNVGFSQSILIALAAAFLTITTFTFSTILTVLNTYASSFTPRVVENFINMKITLKVIGIFIGGFFYCIGSLVFTREVFQNDVVITGFVAIVYSIICIIYFIIFVQSVITKFQGVNVILDVANIAQSVIDQEVKMRKEFPTDTQNESRRSIDIYPEQAGYLSVIDLDKLVSMMKDKEGFLSIETKIGEYVTENTVIAQLYLYNEVKETYISKILDCFILQDRKIENSDYRYNITKLLEIALRAISPGINDPNTAIHCINKLGVLLSSFAKINNYHIQKAESQNFKIFYSTYAFKEDLATFYLPLIHYGKEDLQVILAILKSLALMYHVATEKNKKHIHHLVTHLTQKAYPCFATDLEKLLFQQALSQFDA